MLRDSTWGHPQPEVILPSLIPLVFERFFAYFNFVVVPKQSPQFLLNHLAPFVGPTQGREGIISKTMKAKTYEPL